MGERARSGLGRNGCVSHTIIEQLSVVEDILSEQEAALGISLAGYKNHVYRMVNYCHAISPLSGDESEKIAIAGCFHDLGIWTAGTFDYLPPSIELARSHLSKIGRVDWAEHVTLMIEEHHKLRTFKTDDLTEIFRKADLIDLSLTAFRFGIDKGFIRELSARFPNCGFHLGLIRVASKWICRHPFNPIPVARF